MKEISYSKILLVAKNAHLYFFDSLNNIDVISGRRRKLQVQVSQPSSSHMNSYS